MQSHTFDILLVADFRYPGGTASAVAEEIKAAATAGYKIGLVPVHASNLYYPHPVNPRVRRLVDIGMATFVPPDVAAEARLAQIHGPFAAGRLPLRAMNLRAERRILVVHQPPFAADGKPYYDLALTRLCAEEILDGTVEWAPVGPLVRAQFMGRNDAPPLLPFDWHNIIDVPHWRCRRGHRKRRKAVLGRHSRPDACKWPAARDAVLEVYPEDPRFLIRILGGGSFLTELMGAYPRNWEVLPFNAEAPERFLASLDLFIYFHHPNWVEAFGCTIAEAMASGLPCILPPHFEALFREGAVYTSPAAAATTALRLWGDAQAYARQSEAARTVVEERFSHGVHVRRLRKLIGAPAAAVRTAPASTSSPRQRVLLVCSNGIGMGHLTRLLAIAKRLPSTIQPVFVTMSQALRVVEEAGYLAEYIPHHRYLGCDIPRWNDHLARELGELIAFYDARVVVFDGNGPFQGVVDAARNSPHTWFVWCRRGMWRRGVGAQFLAREKHFDAVLEPRDLAEAFDAGPTPQSRARARLVDPIRLLDEQEWLPRGLARAELGLDPDRLTVLVQLGSGNNFDYGVVRKLVLERLRARRDVQAVVAEWLIAKRSIEVPDDVKVVRIFPLNRYIRAFDASVSAVGYNSFHELVQAAVPSVLIPNENPEQDDQLARARFAERHGFGLCVRAGEVYRLGPAIDRLLDPSEHRAMADRCRAFARPNGAAEAARMIEELAYLRRGERLQHPLPHEAAAR